MPSINQQIKSLNPQSFGTVRNNLVIEDGLWVNKSALNQGRAHVRRRQKGFYCFICIVLFIIHGRLEESSSSRPIFRSLCVLSQMEILFAVFIVVKEITPGIDRLSETMVLTQNK